MDVNISINNVKLYDGGMQGNSLRSAGYNAQDKAVSGAGKQIIKDESVREKAKPSFDNKGAELSLSENAPVSLSKERQGLRIYEGPEGNAYEVLSRDNTPVVSQKEEIELSDYSVLELKDLLKSGSITQYAYDLELSKRGTEDTSKTAVSEDTKPSYEANYGNNGIDQSGIAGQDSQAARIKPLGGSSDSTSRIDGSDKASGGKNSDLTTGVSDADKKAKEARMQKNEEALEDMFKSIYEEPKPLSEILPQYALNEEQGMGVKLG